LWAIGRYPSAATKNMTVATIGKDQFVRHGPARAMFRKENDVAVAGSMEPRA